MTDQPQTKPRKKVIDIQVDFDQATIGDLDLFGRAESGDLDVSELNDFLDRIVVGGVRHLPLSSYPDILAELKIAFDEMADPMTGPEGEKKA